jgi:hypothetical protein
MKFEVEAHLSLADGLATWRFNHPMGLYEVTLKNHDVKPGVAKPLLHAYITFDAADLDSAPDTGTRLLRRFLEYMSFGTGSRFLVHRRLGIFDWSPGVKTRHGRIFRAFPDPNLPVPILNQELADRLLPFINADATHEVLCGLRWFAEGVSASAPDEQFQFFWFAIETLALESRDTTRVPDRCARCRSPLYCPECKETPTHRPYPNQAIEQLFHRHVLDLADRSYRAATAMRHALLHGDDISNVESQQGVTLSQLVNVVGKVAWAALTTALIRARAAVAPGEEIGFIQPNTFLHYGLEPVVMMSFESPTDRDPNIDDIPDLDIDLIVSAVQPDKDQSGHCTW